MICSLVEHVIVAPFVIPAKAGIQIKKNNWIPHQVRNDSIFTWMLVESSDFQSESFTESHL